MTDNFFYEILIPGLSVITISFLCAEFIGRSKHIGRNFTFLMMLGIIPGIISLMSSPSAKKSPTKPNSAYYYLGIFLVIASISTIFSDIENITYIHVFVSISFVSSAIYCFALSEGKVVNKTPKYYFEKTLPQGTEFKKTAEVKKDFDASIESLTNLKNKGIITDEFYYEKVAKIKTEKLKEELQNSLEYKQLYGLFSSGILTEKEFESKVRLIKTEVQILKDNITKYLSKKDLDIIKVHFGRNNKKVNVQLRTKLEKVLKIQTNLSDVELIEIIIKELEKT